MPNILTKWSEDQEINALVNAYWSEFLMEQVVLSQGTQGQSSRSETSHDAMEFGQMQLAIQKLEHAKLEVQVYSGAIAKEAESWIGDGVALSCKQSSSKKPVTQFILWSSSTVSH